MKTVHLYIAYVWDCQECGRENFCLPVEYHPSEAELVDIAADTGRTVWEVENDLVYTTPPQHVDCQHCFHKTVSHELGADDTEIDSTELRPAWVWMCPKCDVKHYLRSLVIENPDEIEASKQKMGIPESESGFFKTSPPFIVCDNCSTEFKTTAEELL